VKKKNLKNSTISWGNATIVSEVDLSYYTRSILVKDLILSIQMVCDYKKNRAFTSKNNKELMNLDIKE